VGVAATLLLRRPPVHGARNHQAANAVGPLHMKVKLMLLLAALAPLILAGCGKKY
jgi:hypothetical protein